MDSKETLRRLQLAELDILCMLDDFCTQHDITWFMDAGTALGAMRHKGFIPWDDDIDVGMVRSDYDRFIELAKTELPEGYSLHLPTTTHGQAALFAKVVRDSTRFENKETRQAGYAQGIFVDIFPYDYLPKDKNMRGHMISAASTAQKKSYLYWSRSITVPHRGALGFFERMVCSAAHYVLRLTVRDSAQFYRDYENAVVRDPDKLSNELLTLVWPHMDPVPEDVLFPTATAEFEGRRFPIAAQPDVYLTTMYGDWRKLPPEHERHTHLPLLIDFGGGRQDIWVKED